MIKNVFMELFMFVMKNNNQLPSPTIQWFLNDKSEYFYLISGKIKYGKL